MRWRIDDDDDGDEDDGDGDDDDDDRNIINIKNHVLVKLKSTILHPLRSKSIYHLITPLTVVYVFSPNLVDLGLLDLDLDRLTRSI